MAIEAISNAAAALRQELEAVGGDSITLSTHDDDGACTFLAHVAIGEKADASKKALDALDEEAV